MISQDFIANENVRLKTGGRVAECACDENTRLLRLKLMHAYQIRRANEHQALR